MTFDWRVDIGTVLSAIGLTAALAGGLFTLIRRLCGRLDRLDDRQAITQQQMTVHMAETSRRLEELVADVRELRLCLMPGRGPEGR